ncbi:MAG: EF-hand domain-containing protein [Opitutales bacterium]|jgi:Ca2+-binding EF-hand superfamily protein
MKKIITLITLSILACSAQAKWDMFKACDQDKDGAVTKEEWIAQRKQSAKTKGNEYDEAKTLKTFDRTDANGDGTISREEMDALQAKWNK